MNEQSTTRGTASGPERVAVVTGAAAGGIGTSVVRDLARTHRVVAIGRNAERLAERLRDVAGVECVELDLADFDRYAAALAHLDRVDVLVHAAAVSERFTLEAAPLDAWRSHLDINVIAPAMLTQTLLGRLRDVRGQVVFVNSGAGVRAVPTTSVYTASKFALNGLADAFRGEEGASGVRVATVYPGETATPMLHSDRAARGAVWEPERYIEPASIAAAIRAVVDASPDAQLTHLHVRPRSEISSAP
ncbi:SDR family oxidoreductase [Microbacterium allomyrinae]|uniref:SDR family oxidoreductase n=1 Tax=Microbacterium allomyrinae TaxID=2830666 RepID=A0A9X1LT94_9MICO|nr:SDR family oxidoreductase [Microbacterium allomyrinae]MCC2031554.1 SDR family oxidoreductase [Microbacterium allomyrinae]